MYIDNDKKIILESTKIRCSWQIKQEVISLDSSYSFKIWEKSEECSQLIYKKEQVQPWSH
jgi:hypothetical protein